MKKRKKHILSRSGIMYRVTFDDNQEKVQIIFLSINPVRINRNKRDIQYALNFRNLALEMVEEDKKSVTYICPKGLQKSLLRALEKS